MGDFTRLADLLLTNDLDTALRLLDRQTSIGGGGGFLGLGIWRYRTSTTSTPSSGQLQFDDTTIADATELYVHAVNDNGADMSAFLDLLSAFDLMYIQVQVDASQFVTLQIGTPSLASSVYTFPIAQIQGQGTTPSNNTEVAVVIERSGGSSGVTDHGALTGLSDDDHTNYLHKDITRHLTVGYTTDVEADTFTDPLVPDFSLEYFKTTTVTQSFTLDTPTGNSHGEYYLTIDNGGPYTLTAGTNVTLMDNHATMEADTNYVLNIHRYSATNTIAQLLPANGAGYTTWNAHGNDAVGGGAFSLGDSLTIPTTVSYKINGEDIVSRRSGFEIDLGVSNTSIAGDTTANTNVVIGHLNVFAFTPRRSFMSGIGNLCNWRNDCLVGIDNETSTVIGGDNITVGISNYADRVSLSYGRDNIADYGSVVFGDGNTGNKGVIMGINCSADGISGSFVALADGFGCTATGQDCGAFGISITNTVNNSFKIGTNDNTAIVIHGNGLGVALDTPLARLHLGPGSSSVPSITMDVSNQLITTPLAGSIEYSSQTQTKTIGIGDFSVADPTVVTIVDHQFADGATVSFLGTGGNGTFIPANAAGIYTINVLTADTFEVTGLECTVTTTATSTVTGPHQDRYIYFTHQDGTRANVVTTHVVNIDDTDDPYAVPIDAAVVVCNVTNGNVTATLPTAASAKDRIFNIKVYATSGNFKLRLQGDGSETIDKSAFWDISGGLGPTGVNLTVASDGTEWWITY